MNNQNNINEYLLAYQDLKYRDFQKKIIGVDVDIIGVRTDRLKKIAKELAKYVSENNSLQQLTTASTCYEELTIKGLAIGYLKEDNEKVVEILKAYAKQINNWATNDIVAANLKHLKNTKEGIKFVEWCLKQSEEYVIRFGLVILLDQFMNEYYIDYIIEKAMLVKSEFYYVKMAVAWLLSICYINFPEITINVLDGRLDMFTHNKTISKIIDSRCVDNDTKQHLKTLRIKKKSV